MSFENYFYSQVEAISTVWIYKMPIILQVNAIDKVLRPNGDFGVIPARS